MPKNLIDAGGTPLLNIVSYARRGPGRRDHLSPAEIELTQRTVSRTPEVMVKVLTRGATTLKAVRDHFAYLNRGGELEIETDEGERLAGQGAERRLREDWDLDLEQHRRRADLTPRKDHSPPRLVHKILFSMPPGTPPEKVLQAVKNFAREEFALKHRYAMVLHTDEPHPHVHMVVKAVSEQGERLNIRKVTLRRWRSEFARQLRLQGVAANATERAVRGVMRPPASDGVYRTRLRESSTVVREVLSRSAAGASEFHDRIARSRSELSATRHAVEQGWLGVKQLLMHDQRPDLALDVQKFVGQMPSVRTAQEVLIAAHRQRPDRGFSPTR